MTEVFQMVLAGWIFCATVLAQSDGTIYHDALIRRNGAVIVAAHSGYDWYVFQISKDGKKGLVSRFPELLFPTPNRRPRGRRPTSAWAATRVLPTRLDGPTGAQTDPKESSWNDSVAHWH